MVPLLLVPFLILIPVISITPITIFEPSVKDSVVRTANQGISITKDVFVNQLHSAFYNKLLRVEEKLVDLFVFLAETV